MKLISSKEVYKCGLFTVTDDHASDGKGYEIHRSIVRHAGSAVMMAVDAKKRILLVRQYRLPGGRTWEAERDRAADAVIDQVTRFAPNFRNSVIARRALAPLDLEREFGLVGGDIFHGKLSLNQLFSARPVLGHGNYRMPVKGLYLCGSGAHPGGGVTGIPGHNAAREALRDAKRHVY